MSKDCANQNCLGCALTRRRFLSVGCAGAAGLAAAGKLAASGKPAGRQALASDPRRFRIRVIHSLHGPVQKEPDWPNVGFDFRPVMDRFNTALTAACPDYEFIFTMASGQKDAEKILANDARFPVDGYIVFQMNCWNQVVQSVAATGKPVLYVDFQYAGSGGFLVYNAAFLRAGTPNVAFVASSWPDDVTNAARCFDIVRKTGSTADFTAAVTKLRLDRTPGPSRSPLNDDHLETLDPQDTLNLMKQSRILAIGGDWPGLAPAVKAAMGIEVINVPFEELNAAWKAADKSESLAVADRWMKSARRVVDVKPETILDSAAMFLAQKAVLSRYDARCITINCLGGFYGGHIHAYPCLGFHELLNQGLIGACECDVRSSATMVTISALTKGRPGYISDPVLDAGTRRIIYAHCVATNRVFGPSGPANPFEIMTHSEDRQGAAVRSLLPLGYMTTTVQVMPEKKTILFHHGRAVHNVDEDRACRTKLAVEPEGDFEKLFRFWDQWGWHRVTYYGDLSPHIRGLADALGWQAVEEA